MVDLLIRLVDEGHAQLLQVIHLLHHYFFVELEVGDAVEQQAAGRGAGAGGERGGGGGDAKAGRQCRRC